MKIIGHGHWATILETLLSSKHRTWCYLEKDQMNTLLLCIDLYWLRVGKCFNIRDLSRFTLLNTGPF